MPYEIRIQVRFWIKIFFQFDFPVTFHSLAKWSLRYIILQDFSLNNTYIYFGIQSEYKVKIGDESWLWQSTVMLDKKKTNRSWVDKVQCKHLQGSCALSIYVLNATERSISCVLMNNSSYLKPAPKQLLFFLSGFMPFILKHHKYLKDPKLFDPFKPAKWPRWL